MVEKYNKTFLPSLLQEKRNFRLFYSIVQCSGVTITSTVAVVVVEWSGRRGGAQDFFHNVNIMIIAWPSII